MDHEAYEKQMIDTVNRNAEENASTHGSTATAKKSVFTNRDVRTLKQGLKRTVFALFTAVTFAFSVCCFIATATAPGYLAVALFLTAIVAMGIAFIFLYAQGIARMESQGESK